MFCYNVDTIQYGSLDEVIVTASGIVSSVESEANNSNADVKVGNNNSNKMQSFLKAASVTQKFKTQLLNLMTCIEGRLIPS